VSSTQNIQYITHGNEKKREKREREKQGRKPKKTQFDPPSLADLAANIRKSIPSSAIVNNSWNRDSAESDRAPRGEFDFLQRLDYEFRGRALKVSRHRKSAAREPVGDRARGVYPVHPIRIIPHKRAARITRHFSGSLNV